MNKKQFVAICVLLLGILAYAVYEISKLSNRIDRIENKLGGPKKIACNEKNTVEMVRQSVVRIVGGGSEGSGFAVKQNGYILTNFHVIDSEPDPKVILPDNTFDTAKVIMADKDADLAVIKITKDLPVVNFARLDKICPVEELLAIGYPLGGELSGESSVTRGSFSRSATDKKNGVKYILTDMTLVEGISGGPMVNICGEVVGINTGGLFLGGMAMAVSSDTILEKCRLMSASKDKLKDVKKTIFMPNKSALEAVRAFYNYLKARRLDKAFELLSDNFVQGYSFEHFTQGYRQMLDTSLVIIKRDKEVPNRIMVKLSTKDLVDVEIVYKYFEGYWDVRKIDGKWLLWKPRIREIKNPDEDWFVDQDLKKEVEEFAKDHEDFGEYWPQIYILKQEPGNEDLSLQELYDRVKEAEERIRNE